MTQFRRRSVFVALAASLSGMPAFAQPGLDSMGFPGASRERSSGLQGIVNAGMTWDPDGPGPLTDRLVIGGSFRSVDGITAESIAIWDGEQWGPMGDGFAAFVVAGGEFGNQAEVTALAIHNNALHAATNFGGGSVRRWDGTDWVAVGSSFIGRANVLASVQGALVAGLSPTGQSSSFAPLVRQNTNGTWSAIPGTPSFASNASVRAIVEFQGDLFVAGDFLIGGVAERIMRRNPAGQWSSTQLRCEGTCTGSVRSLVVANGELFAAGDFSATDGQFPGTVRWSGSAWTTAGAPSTTAGVRSMLLGADGALLRTNHGRVERWSGQAWQSQGPNSAIDNASVGPRLIANFAGRPVLGGAFSTVLESPRVFHTDRKIQPPAILAEDGFWRSPTRGIDGYVRRLRRIGDDIVATGPIYGAGNQPAGFLSRLTPQGRWEPWYDGVGFDRPTRAIVEFQGDIIVSGAFSGSSPPGVISGAVIRRWNGSQWMDMTPLPGLVEEFFVVQGSLWATLRNSFGGGVDELYRWMQDDWQQVASLDYRIANFVVINDELWATYRGNGGSPYGEVVRLEGDQWVAVGGASSLGKQLLGEFQGSVFAVDASNLYTLSATDSNWVRVGAFPALWQGMRFDPANNLEAHNGWYVSARDINLRPVIVFWDGSRWSTLGAWNEQGVGAEWGPSLVLHNEDVLMGASFPGGFVVNEPPYRRNRAAASVVRVRAGWPIPTPALVDVTASAGDEVVLGFDPQELSGYSWILNGRPATNTPGSLGRFEGTSAGQLRILQARVSDTGPYSVGRRLSDRCFISNPSTLAQSFATPAYLTILPTCDPIDFNNDGSLFDPVDIDAFFSVFAEGPCLPLGATCNDIDFNNDTIRFDPRDIDAFLSVFTGGPCQ
jgi:hypothetical protein